MSENSVFTHTIAVRWADCDPARIAYTGRLPNFALEAIDAWWEAHVGEDWYRMNVDGNIGTPFVHLSMDFRKPVTPRYPLVCEVRLLKLGNSSIRFSVRGLQDEALCFEGEFVEVFVTSPGFEKSGVPEKFKTRLESALS
ncbi:MAG: acyl-CoA thioesterase [Pseudomonadota bacterium]